MVSKIRTLSFKLSRMIIFLVLKKVLLNIQEVFLARFVFNALIFSQLAFKNLVGDTPMFTAARHGNLGPS